MNAEEMPMLESIVAFPNVPINFKDDVYTNGENESVQSLKRKRRSTRVIPISDVSRRLTKRKLLHNRRCIVSNFMCYFGLFGIFLMIIENELCFRDIQHSKTLISFLIKTLISTTTVILVYLVIYYNRLTLIRYPMNNYLHSWRVELTGRKVFLILLEIVICSIHPMPRHLPILSKTTEIPITTSNVEIDLILGLPMFLRLYLLCRFIMYRSHLVHNASSQSIGSLNEVTINFMFLIKTYLERWPTRCLLVISLFFFFIGSWALRACNYDSTGEHFSLTNSMWLFIATFTTVGYGDIAPSTYCGRSIATIVALTGIMSTALLISVVAQKLTMNRSEKYVHYFVLQIDLEKQRRHQAANVIKSALRVWYLKRKRQQHSFSYFRAQRRLMESIHLNHQLKHEGKQFIDTCIGFPEVITLQRESNKKIQETTKHSMILQKKIEEIELTITNMNQMIINMQRTLDCFLKKPPL